MAKLDRPDHKKRDMTFVYFARAQVSGLIKIGFSVNPDARCTNLAAEVGEDVRVMFTVPGNRVQEKGYHKRFADCRVRGEWFYETGRLHEFLKGRGYGGTKIVLQKEILVQPGPTRVIEVLRHRADGAATVPWSVGYARVSTDEQNLDVQISALRVAGVADEDMFVEKMSAVNAKRPQFRLMMKYVEAGDSLLIHSLSRLGRDMRQLHHILDQLAAEGVTWRSLTEPHLDTATAAGRLMLNITGGMAQFERDQIIERTKRGMQELKRQGMFLGRKRIVTAEVEAQMRAMRYDDKIAVVKIAKRFKVKASTVYANTQRKQKLKAS